MAAVSVVFPWSTWPMVPTFTWGFVRSNFSLLMCSPCYPSKWSPPPGLNWRPRPYQGRALPTELGGPGSLWWAAFVRYRQWSGKRDSNPRHSAWKADALPTELFPHTHRSWRGLDSNQRRRRAGRFTVCSLWPLGYPSACLLSSSLRRGVRLPDRATYDKPAAGFEPATF